MESALSSSAETLAAIRRRLPGSLIVVIVLGLITAAVALGLPPVYRSRAVILIEQQDIPQDLVRSLVTSYADQRIQVIGQRVLTNSNLTAIIEKFGLYAEERKSKPLERVLAEMREDITVEPISADVVDQRSGRPTKATIAFELAFDSGSPVLAQRVANDLVSLFLSENLKQRSEAAEDALTFLAAESTRLRVVVADIERRLAEFKEANAGSLPELNALNMQMLNRGEQDIIQLDNQIRSLEQQRVYLESELAQQAPNAEIRVAENGQRIVGPADRLKALETDYITLSARYGSGHPDVIKMRREIDSLRSATGNAQSADEAAARLQALEAELVTEGERYSDSHPVIRRLKREIDALRGSIVRGSQSTTGGASAPVPDNPVYVQLKTRLDATLGDIASLRAQQASIRAKNASIEALLGSAPQVERDYRALSRDYELAQAEYREILAKKQEAELARSLESENKGERFTLIEPPVSPEEPDRPNRLVVGFLGLMVTLAAGAGFGVINEHLDDRIYGRAQVIRLTGVPPLAVIPVLQSPEGRRLLTRRRWLLMTFIFGTLILLLFVVHIWVQPLDVLYFRALRVLSN